MLGSVAYAATIVLSSVAWILLFARRFLAWQSLREHFSDCIGSLIAIALGSGVSVTALLGCWYLVFGSIGGLLEPILGERGTDLVQLATFAIALCGIAVVFILADVTRAVVIANRTTTRHALSTALIVYRRTWPKLSLNALVRLSSAVLLQASLTWLVAHYQWLSGPTSACFAAAVAIEISTLLAIMLRVGWIAFLLAQANEFRRTARH
jgi:hypothetical protein